MPSTVQRPRARQLGLIVGRFEPGPGNAITDVSGVMVGHSTIVSGSGRHAPGRGPVRTGVTAILPQAGNVFEERVVGGGFVLNGAGEVSGLTQVMEWGLIETPILLTNTLSVGTCSEATVQFMIDTYPSIGRESDVIIPVVGECDDSWLNDVVGRHVRHEHVYEAIETATPGPVAEGSVGGGTGMMTCGFKSGIGTSSRRVEPLGTGHPTSYALGVLVMSNFGVMGELRISGLPVGRLLEDRYADHQTRRKHYGSIVAVAATDAPLRSHQLDRLSKRVALGIGRMGSYAAHTSGEIVVAFSTGNLVPRRSQRMIHQMDVLLDSAMDPFYEAAVEATEEAILNALCVADEMDGIDYRVAPGFPAVDAAKIVLRAQAAARLAEAEE